jgi:hypothetical protein
MREPAYRLYNCARCQLQVRICLRCDHGNVYCAGECASIRRRESLRHAQARYQRSRRGARRHAERQRQWRARQRQTPQIVTHQGSPGIATQCIVAVSPVMQSQCVIHAMSVHSFTACRSSVSRVHIPADGERGFQRIVNAYSSGT